MEQMGLEFDDAAFSEDYVGNETETTEVVNSPKVVEETAENAKVEEVAKEVVEEKVSDGKPTTETSRGSAMEEMLLKKLNELAEKQAQQEDIINKQNQLISTLTQEKVSAELGGTSDKVSTNGGALNSQLVSLIEQLREQNSTPKLVKVINLTNCIQCQYETTKGNYITFTSYGQSFPVSEADAEILLNKYKPTFECGGLVFDADHLYMMRDKGIDVEKINYHPLETIEKANEVSIEELKKIFYGMAVYQRDMLKLHIAGKLMEKKDFLPIETVRHINKWSKDIMGTKLGGYENILNRMMEIENEK